MRVHLTICDDDRSMEVEVEDDQPYNPEVLTDWLRRAGEAVEHQFVTVQMVRRRFEGGEA